jgi:hypothetical protein
MGIVRKEKPKGRPRTSKQVEEHIRQSCLRSTEKCIAHHSLELSVPKTTIQNVLHKHLRLHAYKIQLRHEIKATGHSKHVKFADFMLIETDDIEGYLCWVMVKVEATFHITSCISHYSCRCLDYNN